MKKESLNEDLQEVKNYWYSKIPKKIRHLTTGIIAGIVLFSFSLLFVLEIGLINISWGKSSDSYEESSKTEKCSEDKVSIENFGRNEECVSWRNNFGLDALVFLDDEKNIVRPSLTENFSTGREVFLEKKFGSDNQTSLEIIPQSEEKVNASINYGFQWRVIVGDGDYNRVRLQFNSKYPKENLSTNDWVTVPELSGKNWIFPNRGLEPRKKISIIVRSQAKEGSNIVDVDVAVKGFLKGGDRSEDFNFHYSVSMTQKASESFERIGFGLLDPHQENIATMLQYFEVIPLSRYHAQ